MSEKPPLKPCKHCRKIALMVFVGGALILLSPLDKTGFAFFIGGILFIGGTAAAFEYGEDRRE